MAPEQLDSVLLPKRFLALFPQRFGSTFRSTNGTTWRAMSQFHYLEDASILASLGGSSKNIRACLPDKKTSFLALTCSIGDDGFDFGAAKRVVEKLQDAGLKPCIYKESGSTSIQIFLAFSEPIKTDEAAEAIASFVQTEVVNVHDTKTPFVLPLQQGFAWLNNDFSIKVQSDLVAIEAAMAMFLHDLNSNSVSSEVLEAIAEMQQDSEEIDCPSNSLDFLAIEPAATQVSDEYRVVEVAAEPSEQAVPDIDVQDSVETNISPAQMPDLPAQVPVPGGQQLLLFPVASQVVQLEHPKERPKRKKRARSDLPADTQSDMPTLFTALPLDAQGVQQLLKEAHDD